jgi:hypothetical protein
MMNAVFWDVTPCGRFHPPQTILCIHAISVISCYLVRKSNNSLKFRVTNFYIYIYFFYMGVKHGL